MTSLANPYFNKTPTNEQDLVQGIITECIQVMGNTIYYLPRQVQNLDLVLGEDVTSKFDSYFEIEVYLDNFEGWQGQSELISKFGLEIRNQIVFKMSVTRWEEEISKVPDLSTNMLVSVRPSEGDLIYDPTTKKLFEIKFIDQDWSFHQLGRRTYAYKMTCEMYQYSSDVANTGIPELDLAINDISNNLNDFELLNEDGTRILQEDGSFIFTEQIYADPLVHDTTETFEFEANIIKFNVNNPFNDII